MSSLTTLRDHESYWQRYRQIEDDHYRAAFTYSMCTQLPEDVVDLSAWELLTVEGATAEEILNSRYAQARDPHRASVDLLLEFAARLGNEWALENYVRDEGHIQALRRINPLLAILHRGRFEEWRRGREYDAAVQSLHDEAARDLERMKRGHDDPDELVEREQAIKERLWERQKELGDPYEADVRHTRLTHLYTAIAVATGYGIPFNTDEHIAGLDEITQEEWDAARESALALFRSEWWESG
ncbi:MAG: hypothetical protein F4X98_13190 [Gammaproteobacteria bacterium]|nr:hypothetical protein [Gammaproteobacteria bacterium]